MTSRIQSFGGSHTERKLDVLTKYLAAYVNVMKNWRQFELHYIDGFAGSGASEAKGNQDELLDPGLFETGRITQGSPLRALGIDPPFDRYLFIDENEANVASLRNAIAAHKNGNRADVALGDANEAISEFCKKIKHRQNARAVVFLDPFGRSVRWETVINLANTKKVDLWYLVPVHAISRQVTDKGEFLPSADKTDMMWGSQSWRELAVRKVDTANDLFGQVDDRLEKIARAKQFSEMFRDHLREAFDGRVADVYLPLGRGRLHEFSLMFACANPSANAFQAALRIATHILRTA
jgi:three-Cys-motif partner protein